jgi:Uma2 family endonuclease
MAVLVTDPELAQEIKADRAVSEAGRFDEVWQTDQVMAAPPDNEHQFLGFELAAIARTVVMDAGSGSVCLAVSVSDRQQGWRDNYRIPDVAVFLNGNPAKDCGTHWSGGFDFGIEVATRGDHTRDKIPFYAQIGVRELLLVDREPWALELYRSHDGQLELVGRSTLEQAKVLASEVLPLSFCLQADSARPLIEVTHQDGVQGWLV